MRVGTNPRKSAVFTDPDFFHQVIIPVHIPNLSDYFSGSLNILKLCLSSLIRSSHPKTFITIVNNGSCVEVVDFLNTLLQQGAVHELLHTTAIGKLNAVFKGLTGQSFPLVTIADADVLFINGWQDATYKLFAALPKAGAISTTPHSRTLRYLTSNLIADCVWSKDFRFTPVKNQPAMIRFGESIDNSTFLRPVHLKQYMTLTKNGVRAVAGAGHFVCTYRGEIFDGLKVHPERNYIGSDAIKRRIDRLVVKKGFWRLSTEENYTFHMGNVVEDWMNDEMSRVMPQPELKMPRLIKNESPLFMRFLKDKVAAAILIYPFVWNNFLRLKGLTKEEAANYI